ncbi:hypothetical protein HanOQP8_Chr02g0041661 [Helianthus annuus]|nr:hypothetical protein HanOQP8_Chr02g0041661 [Helianthus annuus]
MDRQPFVPYTNTEIKTRNEPKNLCYGLADAQISDIRDMGFESLKSFSIPDIPRRLEYGLLVNYDHKRNELNVGNRIIKVTPSKVHDVFGVPMGKITVSEKRRLSKKDAIREEWRKQFIWEKISFEHVIEKLKSYRKAGTLFKLNFLVVFNSIIGECTKNLAVYHKFLASIMNEGDISNMDWCSYVITCLKI